MRIYKFGQVLEMSRACLQRSTTRMRRRKGWHVRSLDSLENRCLLAATVIDTNFNSGTGGTTLVGSAFYRSSNTDIALTTETAAAQTGSLVVNNNGAFWSFNAQLRIYAGGDASGGEGYSFGYGSIPSNTAWGESGLSSGVWISVDTNVGGNSSNGAIRVYYNNNSNINSAIATTPFNGNARSALAPDGRRFLNFSVSESGVLTYSHDSLSQQTIQLSNWAPQSNWQFGVGARTGNGLINEDIHVVDELHIFDNTAAPSDIGLDTNSITENSLPSRVGYLSTTDSGGSASFTYSLVSGSGSNDNASFQSLNGRELWTSTALDYEAGSTRSVRVRTTDQAGLTFDKVLTISVTNVNEGPTSVSLSNTFLPENAGVNAVVGSLTATDPDSGDTRTFSLPSGLRDNNSFNIIGSILRANSSFDYESRGLYQVTVRVTDAGGLSLDRSFDIAINNLNEGPTDILLSNASLAENNSINSVIGTLAVNDTESANLVANLKSSNLSSSPNSLVDVGGTLYFAADSNGMGVELLKYSPLSLSAGPVVVSDIASGSASSNPQYLTNVNGVLYFSADSGGNDRELWRSDPFFGTFRITDIAAGFSSSNPRDLTNVNGTLYFTADNGINGRELWKSDGTFAGTSLVRDIRNIGSSNPSSLTNVNGTLYFTANDGSTGYELWRSEPFIGAVQASDIRSGAPSSSPGSLTNVNGTLYFAADDGVNGRELWKSSLASVTSLAKNIRSGNLSSNPTTLTNVNGTLFFTADDGSNGVELWKSDSVTGALLVKDIRVGSTGSNPASLVNVNGTVYFIADNGINGQELWKSDGTSGGTILVSDIRPGSNSSSPGSLTNFQGVVYFAANDGISGIELWRSNGTSAGTVQVNDIRSGTGSSNPTRLTNVNGTLYFSADDGVNGTELWKTSAEVITFSLPPGVSDNNLFSINGSSLQASTSFNFEAESSYSISLRATDSGGLTFDKQFTVTVIGINEAPTNISLSNSIVAENAGINVVIGTLTGTDPDAGDTVTLSLPSGLTNNSLFNISGSSLRASSSFDFEFGSSYTVTVRVTDTGGLTFDKQFSISVNNVNETPTDINLSNSSVAENFANGTAVGNFSTSDPEASNTFTYALVTGTGDTDNASFTIVGNTLKTNTVFDFEAKSAYFIRVQTTDQGGFTFEKQFTVSLIDVPEVPFAITISNDKIAENQPVGTTVGVLSTDDPDLFGVSYTYSLVSGTGDMDNSSYNIAGDVLQTSAVFDFEAKSSYSVRIRTTDQDGLTFEKVFVVTVTNVNEAPTDISLSNSGVAENSANGTAVGNFSTSDPDTSNTFTYALVTGTGDTDNASFTIDGNTLKTIAEFDFELKNSYSIRVRTTDQGNMSFEKLLTVSVTDIDEDVTAPVSSITAMTATSNSLSIPISVTGNDPGANSSGIKEYDLYYSTGGSFIKFATVPVASPSTTFTGSANTTYWFRSLGQDNAGNVETKTTSDTYTRIGDVVAPATQVTSAVPSSGGLFNVQMTGTKVSGTALTVFDVYVSVDGNTPVLVGSANGVSLGSGNYSGQILFQGVLDGTSHTYRFYSRGRDGAGNVETAPVSGDVSVTHSFAAASLAATAIDVQNGLRQRSYVRYFDVLFSSATGVDALLNAGRVKVERFAIDAASVTPGTGVNVPGVVLAQNGYRLRLDFGADGLGGLRQAGNGFYRVLLDIDGNGSFADAGDDAFEFHRLFGDANGDAKVDEADTALVTGQIGRTGSNLDGDLDGNNAVNSTDRLYTTQQRGKKLLDPLLGWLDD